MPLSDTKIRNAKPAAKPYKLFDERGLYIEVTPAGSRLWRLKYRYGGKDKALGAYPDVSLAMAREQRDEARRLLAQGIDPSLHRKVTKAMQAERAANCYSVFPADGYLFLARSLRQERVLPA